MDDLRYITPEELYGHGRSVTSPFFVFGCMLYEAQYMKHPFTTHLNYKGMQEFIKKYPVLYPPEPSNIDDLQDLITNLLIKDPLQRLGSDSMEQEILEHPYFNS